VPCVRARVISPTPEESLSLLAYPGGPLLATIPIHTEAHQRWVSAPTTDSGVEPPVTYRIFDHYGNLAAAITIRWSWWFEQGHAEFDNLRQALQGLIANGWQHDPPGTATDDPFGLHG
jgi:hypothetical protein